MNEQIINGKFGTSAQTFDKTTKFKGASKNGKNWQIEIYYNSKKEYLGCVHDKLFAAKLFDICQI